MQDHGLRSRRCGALELALVRLVMATAAAVLLAACGRQAAVPAAPPVPEVGVLKVEPRPAPLSIELVGDVRALREVELRPRVTGVVERQMFTPGQMVREGQPLFLLDTRALDSGVADAQARLIEAEAQLQRAQQDVARYQPLLADDAIARQTYDQAVAAQKQAESLVESRREGVTRARIDRGFAEVRAPVTGRSACRRLKSADWPAPARPCWRWCRRSTRWSSTSACRRPSTWSFPAVWRAAAGRCGASRSGRSNCCWPMVRSTGTRAGSTSPTAPSIRRPAR